MDSGRSFAQGGRRGAGDSADLRADTSYDRIGTTRRKTQPILTPAARNRCITGSKYGFFTIT
jgi:hypothetical protein